MELRCPAIICGARPHGETGVVVRLLTAQAGLVAGYLAGGRGRMLRPVIIPGNLVEADLRSRTPAQLPALRLELVASRGPWLGEPLASAAIAWVCALTAATLPEGQPYPGLFESLRAALDAICHAPSARGWTVALLAYERLLLRELGYGGGAGPDPAAQWGDVLAAFDRLEAPMRQHLLADRRADVMAARALLRDRLGRIEG